MAKRKTKQKTKTRGITVQVPVDLLASVDSWRAKQPVPPSRAAIFRTALAAWLKASTDAVTARWEQYRGEVTEAMRQAGCSKEDITATEAEMCAELTQHIVSPSKQGPLICRVVSSADGDPTKEAMYRPSLVGFLIAEAADPK